MLKLVCYIYYFLHYLLFKHQRLLAFSKIIINNFWSHTKLFCRTMWLPNFLRYQVTELVSYSCIYTVWNGGCDGTVVPATSGHLRFGEKVAPRGRERKFMTSSQKLRYIHILHIINIAAKVQNSNTTFNYYILMSTYTLNDNII